MPSPAPDTSRTLDAARERVVRLLTDRYADDTLDVEQFESELDRLNRLTDVDALDRMAGELAAAARGSMTQAPERPALDPIWSAGVGPGVDQAVSLAGVGWQRGTLVPARVPDEGRMVAIMSQSRREGPWAAPRSLHVWAVMSEAVVDLRDAVLPLEGCDIEVGAIMANVRILLPPGITAHVEVLAFMGAAHDHTRAEVGAGHAPRVRVTGSSVMAEVQVFGA